MRIARFLFVLALLAPLTFALQNQPQDKSKRPSPPGTADVTLKGKSVKIDYSRPKVEDPKTGEKRKMIGEHEPYGKEWRTGANEATTLTTADDLDIGGTKVPAGTYTLYTLPEEGNKWTLIISKKTGQWGIPYPGKDDDFARIPMKSGTDNNAVDQFTISFDHAKKNTADLTLSWENWKAWVPIKAE